jgi:3',5'-cyclic AMP phosphodiesterase CpdA
MIEIYHISDLHFGKKNIKARKLIKALDERFEITKSRNKYLLVTGDITQSGTREQYEMALESLEPFKNRIFFVPGNHDYGDFWGVTYDDRKAKDFDAFFSQKLDERQKYYDKKPYVRLLSENEGNKVLLIGLNSCLKIEKFKGAFGLVGYRQLCILKETLALEKYAHVPKLVFLHHIPYQLARGFQMDLLDWDDLFDVAKRSVDIIAFGHEGVMEAHASKEERDRIEESRKMGVRRERFVHAELAYLLDANRSAKDRACYQIRINNNMMLMPRKISLK